VYDDHGMKQTTHPQVMLKLRMSGFITPLKKESFMICIDVFIFKRFVYRPVWDDHPTTYLCRHRREAEV
jgi:hypothetical protein